MTVATPAEVLQAQNDVLSGMYRRPPSKTPFEGRRKFRTAAMYAAFLRAVAARLDEMNAKEF